MVKIIFFKTGALGDVLLTTPLLREIRQKFPDACIDYWAGNYSKRILEGNKEINNLIGFDESAFYKKKLISFLRLLNAIRKEKYDIAFVLDKHWIFSLFFLFTGIKKRIGFRRKVSFNNYDVKYNNSKHEIDFYLDLGAIFNINTANKKPEVFLSNEEDEFGKNYCKSEYYCIINCGGANVGEASNVRFLPDELFEGIVNKASENYKVVLIGGPSDGKRYSAFKFNSNVINSAAELSLKQCVAVMKYAKRIITTDCGPMHMASAVNDNITVIFGPTDPKRRLPFSKNAIAVWKDRDIYDGRYELYGKIPTGSFYKKLSVEDIL